MFLARSLNSIKRELPMTLHPQAKAYLENVLQQGRPGWHELSVDQAREIFQSLDPLCGPRPDLDRVEDLIATDDSSVQIPMRLYSSGKETDVADVADESPPVIIFFHGGGWVLGDLSTHDALCRRLAKESACTVIAVDYRLSPESQFPGPVNDCYAAVKYVADHQRELDVDASRMALVGDSAGGYLATMVALKIREQGGPPVRLQVLIYPVIEADFETPSYQSFADGHGLTRDTMRWFWQHFLGDADPVAASPLRADSLADLPPAIVITAEYDVLRDEGTRYAKRLFESGVDVDHWRIEGMLHGFVHFAGVFDPGIEVARQLANQVSQRLC